MHLETPEFKRCCFCIPLRRGLIGWGYLRLVLDVLGTVYFVFISMFILAFIPTLINMVIILMITSLLLVDIGFTLLLIVAGHMKSAKLLRISFIYSGVWVILVLALGLCAIAISQRHIYELWGYGYHVRVLYGLLSGFVVLFSITVGNGYVTLLIRSEEKKLRKHNLEVQFVNNAADGEAVCVRAAIEQYDVKHGENDVMKLNTHT